jgi:hypothetical protein
MFDENDSWLEGIGVDVSGILGSVQDNSTDNAWFDPSASSNSVSSGAWETFTSGASAAGDLAEAGWDAAAGAGAKVVSGAAGAAAGVASAVGADETAQDLRAAQAAAEADANRYFGEAEGDWARAQQEVFGDQPPPTERPDPPDSGGPPTDRPPPPTERPDRPREGGPPTERDPNARNELDFSSFFGGATDDANSAPATGVALAEDDIPFILGETAIEVVEVEAEWSEGDDDTPTSPTATATIAVKANGDGSFTITGSGFSQRFVSVRAVDDFLGERWFPTESNDGTISVKTPKICVQEGPIHFSVFAGTHPLVSDLLSNIVHAKCGPQKEKEDDESDDDEQDGDEKGGDSQTGQQITATLENDDIINDILLTVDDQNIAKTILFQKPVKGGEKVAITLQTDNFGHGKIEWLTQRPESPSTIKRNIVDNISDGDNIHLFFQ